MYKLKEAVADKNNDNNVVFNVQFSFIVFLKARAKKPDKTNAPPMNLSTRYIFLKIVLGIKYGLSKVCGNKNPINSIAVPIIIIEIANFFI